MENAVTIPARRQSLLRWAKVSAAAPLAFLVVASVVLRAAVGAAKSTPIYFTDEYLYAELGRSLAATGRPLVRGLSPHFPALLQPVLTAPAWMLGDATSGYAYVKLEGGVVMSLAAVPVYLLASRLGLRRSTALLTAALTVAVPEMLYSSWILAEPYAYSLALGAVAAGSVALGGGGRRSRVAFLVLATAAMLARAQFVALPVCFAAATFIVGLRRRALLEALRQQGLVLGAFVLPLVALLLLAPDRILGIYGTFAQVDLGVDGLADRLGTNGFVFLFASGWVVLPGALFGLWLAFARPRSDIELGFAALSGVMALVLFLQASLYGDLDRAQGRYLFYLIPIVALLFCLYASRGWPHARAYALFAASGLLLSAIVPLSGYAEASFKTQSVLLLGVYRIEQLLGTGTGALTVALIAAAGSVLAAALPLLRERGETVGLAVTIALLLAVGAFATNFDTRNTDAVRNDFLPAGATWIDDARLGNVTLLHVAAGRADTLTQLFWNRSVKQVVVPPGGAPPDTYGARQATIDATGALLVDGSPVEGAVLADVADDVISFQDGRVVAGTTTHRLWALTGPARLALYGLGWYGDGWLAARSSMAMWPRPGSEGLAGTVSIRLEAPEDFKRSVPITISWPTGHRSVDVAPGASLNVVLPVCARGQWHAQIATTKPTYLGFRAVSVYATRPVWRPDPTACAPRRARS